MFTVTMKCGLMQVYFTNNSDEFDLFIVPGTVSPCTGSKFRLEAAIVSQTLLLYDPKMMMLCCSIDGDYTEHGLQTMCDL